MQVSANIIKIKTRVAKATLVFLSVMVFAACSVQTRQLFFDIQPPSAEEIAEKNRRENARRESVLAEAEQQITDSRSFGSAQANDNQPRPAIESVTSWEQALEQLPKDYKKKPDWLPQ